MKISRNDPCPCGSGEKYKKCCLDKQAGMAGSASMQGIMDDIRAGVESREFSSLEEVKAAMNQLTQKQNNSPLASFHGLSPSQMHRVLHFPFDSPELVRFAESLEPPVEAPALTLFALLVEAIGEKGLKPTVKGNLPQRFCREAALSFWGQEKYEHRTRFGAIRSEMDFFDLHCLRLVAELAGLVRKYKGKFILTAKCRKKITSQGMEAVYPDLFTAYVQKFNWSYLDGFQDIPFIQQAFLFTLFLLGKYGDELRPQSFYEDIFLAAFPVLLNEIEQVPYQSCEKTLCRAYFYRTLSHFAAFFGLAEVQAISEKDYLTQYELKKTPLLDRFISFAV